MLAVERRERIARELELRGRVEVAAFARIWGFSQMTIRRDLDVLERDGLVRRVRGGAVAVDAGGTRIDAPVRGTLGFIIPEATHEFREMVRGAGALAQSEGFRMLIGTSGDSCTEELRHLARMGERSVDAILLAPAEVSGPDDGQRWERLRSVPTPLVIVDGPKGLSARGVASDVVEADRSLAARVAVQHLASQGHRGVALFLREGRGASDILEGYRGAVETHGLDHEAPMLRRPGLVAAERVGAGVADFVGRCLDSGTSAILVAPDEAAMELVEAIRERGLRVPRDLSIVTVGDSVAALTSVRFTSVATPAWALGHQAAETALLRLRTTAPLPARRVSLVPSLTERESTAGGAASRPIRSEQVSAA